MTCASQWRSCQNASCRKAVARVPHSFAFCAKGWDSFHPNLTRFSITITPAAGDSTNLSTQNKLSS